MDRRDSGSRPTASENRSFLGYLLIRDNKSLQQPSRTACKGRESNPHSRRRLGYSQRNSPLFSPCVPRTGFEPAPTGLKGRDATITPPRSGRTRARTLARLHVYGLANRCIATLPPYLVVLLPSSPGREDWKESQNPSTRASFKSSRDCKALRFGRVVNLSNFRPQLID